MSIKINKTDSLSSIPFERWHSVAPEATGLRYDVLNVFESSKINNLNCTYLTFEKAQTMVGRTHLYEVSMDFSSMDKQISNSARQIIKHWFPNYLNLSMVESGLFAMNGPSLVVNDHRDLPEVIKLTAIELESIAKEKYLDLCVFRDVEIEHYQSYINTLKPLGYLPCAGFSNAIIDIEWQHFDDYIASRNSKTRYKLKSALKYKERFGLDVEITSKFQHLTTEMAQLWANVNASSTDYNREKLDKQFFDDFSKYQEGTHEAILFFHGKTLIAFMWNLIGINDYHMADWGVNYDFPQYKEANLYRAASVLSVKRAIELAKKKIHLGMTNYVPKKLLGAKVQPLIYFIKHIKNPEFTPVVNRMITQSIEQPDRLDYYEKTGDFPKNMTAKAYKQIINNACFNYPDTDVLHTIESSYEIGILKLGGLYSFYPEQHAIDIDLSSCCLFYEAAVQQHIAPYISQAPMFSGFNKSTQQAQTDLAVHFCQEACLLLPTGSNIHKNSFTSLLSEQSIVFLDEASPPHFWEALDACHAKIIPYPHHDIDALSQQIDITGVSSALIVTESISSTMGDCVDLHKLVKLKADKSIRIYLDESMAFGIKGNGVGLAAEFNVLNKIDILAASCVAGFGLDCGVIASDKPCIEHIQHTCLDLIGHLGVPEHYSRQIMSDLSRFHHIKQKIIALHQHVARFVHALKDLDFNISDTNHFIVNIFFADFMLAIAIQRKLLMSSIKCIIVAPPAVPEAMTHLQFKFNQNISAKDIDKLISTFQQIASVLQLKQK